MGSAWTIGAPTNLAGALPRDELGQFLRVFIVAEWIVLCRTMGDD